MSIVRNHVCAEAQKQLRSGIALLVERRVGALRTAAKQRPALITEAVGPLNCRQPDPPHAASGARAQSEFWLCVGGRDK